MNEQRRWILYFAPFLLTAATLIFTATARADTFGKVYYDKKSGQLVVTMHYRGSNPNHNFTLRWGQCQTDQSVSLPTVSVEILDDQFEDSAQADYKKTTRFSLAGMPCDRPANVTLHSAPRFYYTVRIPG